MVIDGRIRRRQTMRNRFSKKHGDGSGHRSGCRYGKRIAAAALVGCMAVSIAGCGGKVEINDGTFRPVDESVSIKREDDAYRYDQLSGQHGI